MAQVHLESAFVWKRRMHRGRELAYTRISGRSSIREECHNERRFLMLSPFRFAWTLTVILAVCGRARAQELAPPGSDVSIYKVAIDSPFSHTVKYHVKGGSARLQALVR